MRPLIGVTTSELRPGELATLRRDGLPPHPEMALGTTYLRAVEAAGGIPVILAPTQLDAVPALVERLDGICLAGGPDIDPFVYGTGERHPRLGSTQPLVDAFELTVARVADAAALPLLGICRGAQALNVARGGTLHQHVDGHRQHELASVPTQQLAVDPGSRLAAITGTELAVNSFHHQAVDLLGTGLRVVARADDGTVEAIEDPSRRFALGVLWHPEEGEDLALFQALVDEARRYRAA
jgi:putative glutamine amidotransferase